MTTQIRDTVVVGIDGTADGERALWYGVALATREDLDLRLVHVAHEIAFYAPMTPYIPPITMREIGQSILMKAARQAEEAGFDADRTSTMLALGPRTPAILRHAEDARYVVLGTRSSELKHLLTGATSLSVAAHASVPVHCVPETWSGDDTLAGRVVVGVDGSRADEQVLREAFDEAAARGAALDIVHAWHPDSPYDSAITGRVMLEDWKKAARHALTRPIEDVAAGHPRVEWALHLDYEGVPAALHEAATHADLLILGRHGHSPTFGLLVGSNTRTLLRTATCPVVVVPVVSGKR